MTLFFFFLGFVLLIGGAELLVRHGARLALTLGVRPLLIALIFMSYGTSSPEVAVTMQAIAGSHTGIGLGNIVGSNIANILLILGLTALIRPLPIAQKLVQLDVPVMIIASGLFYLLCADGMISFVDGCILLAGAVGYTAFTIFESFREKQEIEAGYVREFEHLPPISAPGQKFFSFLMMALAIGLIVLGAQWIIENGVLLALRLGISELVLGLTVVAIGTSLPEAAASIAATIRSEPDLSTGTVIGSNIINLLGVAGLSIVLMRGQIPVSPEVLRFDLPFMTLVAIACLPIFTSGHRIERWEGVLFLVYFGLYLTYLGLKSIAFDALPLFGNTLLLFSAPLALVTLVTIVRRALAARVPRS